MRLIKMIVCTSAHNITKFIHLRLIIISLLMWSTHRDYVPTQRFELGEYSQGITCMMLTNSFVFSDFFFNFSFAQYFQINQISFIIYILGFSLSVHLIDPHIKVTLSFFFSHGFKLDHCRFILVSKNGYDKKIKYGLGL